MAGDHELADGRGVTQPEVEALRADWRNDVGGFADEYNPPRASRVAVAAADGKTPRPPSTSTLPRTECERRSISAASCALESVAMLPTSARSTTKTRLERRCGSGTSVKGPVSV